MAAPVSPVLVLGAGHMGGALIAGWLRAKALRPQDILVLDPAPGARARAAAEAGANLAPGAADLAAARAVFLAVKPQAWREAADALAPRIAPDAVLISIMAGVSAAAIGAAFGGRAVVRAMPNLAVSIGRGAIGLYAANSALCALARDFFAPLGVVAELPDEALLHVVTAVSGSGPAYLYALTEALADAAAGAGLPAADAASLARATVVGAAALMGESQESPAELRRAITSAAGTTEAGLRVLQRADGLGPLIERTIAAARARSEALGGPHR